MDGKKFLSLIAIILIVTTMGNFRCGDANSSDGETLYVGGSGEGNYTKIQDAIDNASDGDMIFVYNNSSPYNENVVVNKSISLVGENKEDTIIDGGGKEHVVAIGYYVEGSISGFRIMNSSGEEGWAGIAIWKSNFHISNCIIMNNYIGIGFANSSGSISNCNISNNRYDIYFYNSPNQISNCNISNGNYGIYLDSSSNDQISNCEIDDNLYGIYVDSSIDNTLNCNCFNNSNAIWLSHSSNNTIENCKCFNNSNAILLMHSSNNTIDDCEIYSNDGDGVLLRSSSGNSISSSHISNNGNGISLSDSSNNAIVDSNISKNIEGFYLNSSSNNSIVGCDIFKNYEGVHLENSFNNCVYHNNFINNAIQAYDNSTNFWNMTSGNYWSDYEKRYPNAIQIDRIWNIAYGISGGWNEDWYPLVYKWGKIPPIARFSPSIDNPTTQDKIEFIDESMDIDGSIVGWKWDFGDGNASYSSSPTHRYADDGTYQVNLTVTDNNERKNETYLQIIVLNVPPIARFSWEPESPTTQNVHFIDKSTDLDGIVSVWHWYFGDGGESSLPEPVHSYHRAGSYLVKLIVGDDDGAADSISKEIIVSNSPPIAKFNYSPTSPNTLDGIEFVDNSTDLDGSIVEWHWDFGDGTASTERNATHKYDEGKYMVTLTVKDDDGATSDFSLPLEVERRAKYQIIPGFEPLFIVAAICISILIRRRIRR
jgi:parallel beta-helix repeat protein